MTKRKNIKQLLLFLVLLSTWATAFHKAVAQDDDFFIEEPADFDEPEEFDVPPPPADDGDVPAGPGGFIPPPIRGGGGVRNTGRLGNPNSGVQNRINRDASAGGIYFQLVDPPRYWKKKPRPPMQKPKAY